MPIIAGGSGLYIKAIIDGISDVVDTDEEYRAELLSIKKVQGINGLYDLLKNVDPVSASRMLPQNWKRVIRALEVFKLSGKYIWQIHETQHRESGIEFKQYGLRWDRELLYANINQRVDEMIEAGLVDEVEELINIYKDVSLNSLNTVGYKEIIAYLSNEIPLDHAIELIKRNTRRYAKRQMTWFNADNRIKWIDINNETKLDNIAEFIYTKEIKN